MKRIRILILLLCTQLCWPQKPIEGQIAEITSDGWHEILITPEIRAASKWDLADFRIHDKKGNEVPYFLSGMNLPQNSNLFEQFEIISENTIPGNSTTLTIANPRPELTEISLLIVNSAVTKQYRISGSNDQQKWFGLIDNDSLQYINNPASTAVSKTIALPKTSYKFLKIAFDDTKTLPINVTRIGNYRIGIKAQQEFVEIEAAKIKTKNIGKTTVVSIEMDGLYSIDRIQFEINQPKLFKRPARVYYVESVKKKRKTVQQQINLAELELASDRDKSIDLPSNKTGSLFIEIANGDNKPLDISKIRLLQRPIYAISELQKGEIYAVSSGFEQRNAPMYDIEYFSKQILEKVNPAKITAIKFAKAASDTISKPFWQRSWFLWLCIAIAGLAILYFSISLIRDLNK